MGLVYGPWFSITAGGRVLNTVLHLPMTPTPPLKNSSHGLAGFGLPERTTFLRNLWYIKNLKGTSLTVQWLRLHTPNAGGLGSILGQELDPICYN